MKTYSGVAATNERSAVLTDCPLCGNTLDHLWECETHRYSNCVACGLIIQNPRPHQDDLIERYSGHYFEYEKEQEKNFFRLAAMALVDIRFKEKLAEEVPEKSILDIGCATGRLLKEIKEQMGWRVKGVEVCAGSVRYGREVNGVDIEENTLAGANFPESSFGVVHASHLIEHLTDPFVFVEETRRILKPGGLFICTTPNSESYQRKKFQSRWRSAIADHIVLFGKSNLTFLCEKNGLNRIDLKTWGGLGLGYGHPLEKKYRDWLVKKTGQGDVMIGVFKKNED